LPYLADSKSEQHENYTNYFTARHYYVGFLIALAAILWNSPSISL